MNRVLTDIKSIGGVVGSFLYDLKAGVLASDAPGVFKPEKLAQVGRALTKTFAAGNISVKDLQDLVLQYEEVLILARPVEKNVYLVVLCDPTINVNLLVMSLRLAMDEVREAVAALGEIPAAQSPPAAAPVASSARPHAPAAPAPPQPPPAVGIGEGDKALLGAALAKVMGPMALVVFAEAFDKWSGTTGGDRAAIGSLIDELCSEIGAPDKVERFLSLVPQSLKEGLQ